MPGAINAVLDFIIIGLVSISWSDRSWESFANETSSRFPCSGSYGLRHRRKAYSQASSSVQGCAFPRFSNLVRGPANKEAASVCIISIIRLVVLSRLENDDVTWNFVNSAIWSAAEPCMGVISAVSAPSSKATVHPDDGHSVSRVYDRLWL